MFVAFIILTSISGSATDRGKEALVSCMLKLEERNSPVLVILDELEDMTDNSKKDLEDLLKCMTKVCLKLIVVVCCKREPFLIGECRLVSREGGEWEESCCL